MTARPRPSPDDGPDPLRMTPRRLADEFHRAAEDLARIQLRLHALAPYLDSRPLDALRDRVSDCAARAIDCSVAVRVGLAPIVAFGQVTSMPERPLIDAIEARADAPPAANGEPSGEKPARKKREPPPAAWKCRVCGCTDDDCSQCIEKTGEACYWVESDLCSACADEHKPTLTGRRGKPPAEFTEADGAPPAPLPAPKAPRKKREKPPPADWRGKSILCLDAPAALLLKIREAASVATIGDLDDAIGTSLADQLRFAQRAGVTEAEAVRVIEEIERYARGDDGEPPPPPPPPAPKAPRTKREKPPPIPPDSVAARVVHAPRTDDGAALAGLMTPAAPPAGDVFLIPGLPRGGRELPDALGIAETAEAIYAMNSAGMDVHDPRKIPSLRGVLKVRGRPYAMTGGLVRGAEILELKLTPLLEIDLWKGPRFHHLDPDKGYYGVAVKYRAMYYVCGHKSQEITLVYPRVESPSEEAHPPAPRAWIARDREGGRFLGRFTAADYTRACLHAEQAWPDVPRKRLDVHRAPAGDDTEDDADAFREQFGAPEVGAPKPARKPAQYSFRVFAVAREGTSVSLGEMKSPTRDEATRMAPAAFAGVEFESQRGGREVVGPGTTLQVVPAHAPAPAPNPRPRKKAEVAP